MRDAATVALLRDGKKELEVYLVRKSRSLEFAGGAFVFPGGGVDDEDFDPEWEKRFAEMRALLHPDVGFEFYAAALRELFEEAGILLASELTDAHVIAQLRAEMAGGASFIHTVKKHRIKLLPEKLIFFSHWITPEIYATRFNTRFFLAEIPGGQSPSPDGTETKEGKWISPQAAVADSDENRLALMPPTRATLEELAEFSTASEALTWAGECVVAARQPWIDENGNLHLPKR